METLLPPSVPNEEKWRQRAIAIIRDRIIDVCEASSIGWQQNKINGIEYRRIETGVYGLEWMLVTEGVKLIAETFTYDDGKEERTFTICSKSKGIETLYLGDIVVRPGTDVQALQLTRFDYDSMGKPRHVAVSDGGELEHILALVNNPNN